MMNSKDVYSKLIDRIKSVGTRLENHEEMIEQVMERIELQERQPGQSPSILDLLFGWVHVIWLRRAMALTAICLAAFFIGQQFILMHRLTKLERQIVKSVESESIAEEGPGLKDQFLMNMVMDRPPEGDSITLSRDEFEALLDAYISDRPGQEPDYNLFLDNPAFRNFIKESMTPQSENKEHHSKL